MTALDHWLAAHPGALALAAWVALSLLNAVLPYRALRHGPLLARLVGAALDRLAVLARRDSPGTLALPGLPSAPPADAAPPARRAGDDRVTPLLPVLLLLALAGCSAAQGAQVGRGLSAVDKIVSWVCAVWPGVRGGARALLPDAAVPPVAGDDLAPAPSSAPTVSSGGTAP